MATVMVMDSQQRVGALARRLLEPGLARIIEVHSPLSAMIAEQARASVDGRERGFDGLWCSSLADSTLMGMPDTAVLSIEQRLSRVQDVLAVTGLPLVFDADNGGTVEDFALHVKRMQAVGVSAVIVEDKTGHKRNSLAGAFQQQDDPQRFGAKLCAAQAAASDPDFLVIARIESLILGKGYSDALHRAQVYADAGADAIMIHSKQPAADEVIAFARALRPKLPDLPLVVVPTTFPCVTEGELARAGFSMVIYANHLLRAAYPAMVRAASQILSAGRAEPAEAELIPVADFLRLIEGNTA